MMRIWNGIERYPAERPAVATIGNYDGVHLGHQAILRSVVDRARAAGQTSLLVTFDPHPLSVVAPERRPTLIDTRRQKLENLEATGLDEVLILEFNPSLAALSGEEFFEEVLGSHVPLSAIYVGENFRFGRGRTGDLDLLRKIGARRGFDVEEVSPVCLDERVVSSSTIRSLLTGGDVETANRMLGRPFALLGDVVRGAGRGHSLRYPTANLQTSGELIPRTGVYVTETVCEAARHPSVTNIGTRPTFDGSRVTVETHLLEFDDNLYGREIEVRFLARIRDETRFSGPEELSDQIARDLAAAVSYFENVGLARRP